MPAGQTGMFRVGRLIDFAGLGLLRLDQRVDALRLKAQLAQGISDLFHRLVAVLDLHLGLLLLRHYFRQQRTHHLRVRPMSPFLLGELRVPS
jgi:hypothetical protein